MKIGSRILALVAGLICGITALADAPPALTIGSCVTQSDGSSLCPIKVPGALPAYAPLAKENNSFILLEPQVVRYGAGTKWVEKSFPAGVSTACSNAVFGDSNPNVVKRCELRAGPALTPAAPAASSASASATTSSSTASWGASPVRSQYVGTNLGAVTYYGTNFPFSNLLKHGGGWGSNTADPLILDASGNPVSLKAGQKASMPVAWSYAHYPAGSYTVLWDGTGTISFPLSDIRVTSSLPGRITLEPRTLTGALWISIDTTSPADPVRNVRFLLPGTEATEAVQPFNPTYLQRIAPFSVLRFMDWGKTNGSPVVEWADRAQPTAVSYGTAKGVPIEVMIDLANLLHVDPWFCIPHQASDDYVRQFALLLHTRLDPTLKPHVEYSNEVWNLSFSQTAWAKTQSAVAGLAMPWGTPSIFYAKRSVQVFKIMQQVYGTDASRLVRVLAGQAAWTQFLDNALAYADTATNADVMAVAPYFNVADYKTAATADQVVDQMLVSIRGPVKAWMTASAALAARYHLRLEGYESGPGDTTFAIPATTQDAITNLFADANRSPRMKDVMVEYFTQWKAAGGGLMNQFSDVTAWSKWGYWGALEYVYQDPVTAPKYQGLLAFILSNPAQ